MTYYTNYQTLLSNHQGKKFNELEITEILQQVLIQLAQIHQQGFAHGAISPETLAQDQNNLQNVLLNSPGFAHPSYTAPEQLQSGQISISGDIYSLGVTIIVLLTGKNPESWRNYDGSGNWQDDCFISDQLAGILTTAIAIYPQYRYGDAMQMLAAINSTLTPVISTTNDTLKNQSYADNFQNYQPTYQQNYQSQYPGSTTLQESNQFDNKWYKSLNKGVIIYLISGFVIVIIFGLLQLFSSQKNAQNITQSSQPSPTIANSPNTTNSDVSDPIPNSSTTTSENKLDQVLPTYIVSAFSPNNAFATCPETTKLYLLGETEQFRFAVCGANGKSLYYFGYDKNSGSSVKLSGSDSGFWNGNYLYLPPSYQNTNYTNAVIQVYLNNKLFASRPIITLYKLNENH